VHQLVIKEGSEAISFMQFSEWLLARTIPINQYSTPSTHYLHTELQLTVSLHPTLLRTDQTIFNSQDFNHYKF